MARRVCPYLERKGSFGLLEGGFSSLFDGLHICTLLGHSPLRVVLGPFSPNYSCGYCLLKGVFDLVGVDGGSC